MTSCQRDFASLNYGLVVFFPTAQHLRLNKSSIKDDTVSLDTILRISDVRDRKAPIDIADIDRSVAHFSSHYRYLRKRDAISSP